MSSGAGTGTINYATASPTQLSINGSSISTAATITFSYYPCLPVMGIRIEELQNSANDRTIFFDQVYAYIFNSSTNQFNEFIPGTTWNAAGLDDTSTDFFWSTNYWTSGTAKSPFGTPNSKLFWVTNNSGHSGALSDPPRITDGATWVDFTKPYNGTIGGWNQIDSGPTYLTNFLSMLPFRGRMVTFNTWEGLNPTSSLNYPNRIRWSTIGNPFIPYLPGPPATGSWRSDIRGQGGFLDIPTSEDIISVGFVRDNLVIYCERSTWQLRYTGRSIAPFQIERVNSELGGQGPLSAIQFDTSLVGIGDKGIVECDSYKSERIDIKIPDYIFYFSNLNNAPFRVHGIRDFVNRLAYWTIPQQSSYDPQIPTANQIFPNQRLVYNYENDSWATFNDSLTTLGNYQVQNGRTWINTHLRWIDCKFAWVNSQPASFPSIVGGNQQGFIEYLDQATTNDVSLYISGITANTTTPTNLQVPNHNMQTGFVIGISRIPLGTGFANLNGGIFGVTVVDQNNILLYLYNPDSGQFDTPQLDTFVSDYLGGGLINIRENFNIVSKKFNFLDEGQNIQMGYLDILMDASDTPNAGAISLNVYLDYDDNNPSNTLPQDQVDDGNQPVEADTFFNAIIPTSPSPLSTASAGSKFWQRVYCATRASFLTLEYTFNNAQMAGIEQELDVQIDAQILWIRKGGRMTGL